jgi:hypothetical protein
MPAHVLNPARQHVHQFYPPATRNWTASPMGEDEIAERQARLPLLRAANSKNPRASYEAQVVLARDYRLLLPLQLPRLKPAMRVEVLSWAKRGSMPKGVLCLRGSG